MMVNTLSMIALDSTLVTNLKSQKKRFGNNFELVLLVDPTTKVMSTSTVYDLYSQHRPENKRERDQFENQMIDQVVYTMYNLVTHTVIGVDYNKSINDTFSITDRQTKQERTITYKKYYEEKGYPDLDNNQPLLKTFGRQGAIIHLIPQLCYLTELRREEREVLPKQCSIVPEKRKEKLTKFIEIYNQNEDKLKRCLRLKSKVPKTVSYRVLAPPTLQFPHENFEVIRHKNFRNEKKKSIHWQQRLEKKNFKTFGDL